MADDTVVLLRISGKKSRHIFESNQRNVETVAETDEAACLVAGVNVENTGKVGRLIGDNTNRTACQTCKTDDDILCEVSHYFEEIAVIYYPFDDILHVVWYIRVCGDDGVEYGIFTVGFVSTVLLFRFVHIILRQEGKQFANAHQQFFFGIAHKVSDTAFAAVCHGTAQFFFAYLFVNHSLYHIRTCHKHVTLFFHHKDEVGKGRRVAGASGTRTKNS